MKSYIVAAAAILAASSAFAFGTIKGLGQNLEHERITRSAFACAGNVATDDCFQKKTLDSLAGSPGNFGAVGAPDRGRLLLRSEAHCDGGDYFGVPDYPQTKAQANANLAACRAWMASNLDQAVAAAAELLDAKGNIRDSQIPTFVSCTYAGSKKGRAKCNVLEHFGNILHAAQDFYSHTNWTDAADAKAPSSALNPPGLNKRGPAPYLDLRGGQQFPLGLVSGCFEAKSAISEPKYCNYGPNAAPRVKHLALNKDKGTIDPQIGAGTTDRGKINDNFRHAVEAAVADTKDKWATLKERLVAAYGADRAKKMICALTRDKPIKVC
jgi:hypothetical protein